MANVLGPFGFIQQGTASGKPNFAERGNPPYRIAGGGSPYATPLYRGDLVRMNASLTGYIEQWANADGGTATRIPVGIFDGCEYFSVGQNKTIESAWWPGTTDALGDVLAYVIDDPNALFKCQSGTATPVTLANIGQTADIVAGPTGSTATFQSGMALSTPGTSATNPFKIVNLVVTPLGANGTDDTTAYNYVVVALNNSMFKSQLGV